ncbi:KES1-involved in ergosterol biosynthesis [Fusarium albosuccineum]|uniref:KES1-involved in ergosterol biosynthesis n=1 Tax=Fusarium albosuccineum TaxID=1237068 RepID=A0A8H4P0Q1_9HYPO|nr:KES1-involved in ergosterol biosynthesis [Fusarium albosuccineum]
MESIPRTQGTIHDGDSKSISGRFIDLVKFLSTLKGDLDLANVTAPSYFLAPSSVVENPGSWAQRPSAFTAAANDLDPAKRSLSVLQMFLKGLRNQLYVGGAPNVSIKKPLNAFLGELFLASWTDSESTTKLVVEQVSHHPPITAMHIASKEHGIRADGYGRVEMTFTGNINIRQIGHAIIHVDKFDEDYLVPLPNVTVRGFLSACLYPEIIGSYSIISSSGYVSEINFSGSGFFRGKRNYFEARVYHKDKPKKSCYKLSGIWSEGWKITDANWGVETFDVNATETQPPPMDIDPVNEQDPWESRRAWKDVISALEGGNYRTAAVAKHKVEEAQRQMRVDEKKRGKSWEPLLFRSIPGDEHDVFHRLAEGTNWQLQDSQTKGVWRIDDERLEQTDKPFRR